jgi:hypothetical protein
MLPVTITSNAVGARTSCAAALSMYRCESSTSGYSGADPCHRVAPELRCLEHISLVDAADLSATLARRLECHVRDPDNLRLAVAHRVEPLALARERAVRRLAGAPDVAVQLAHANTSSDGTGMWRI